MQNSLFNYQIFFHSLYSLCIEIPWVVVRGLKSVGSDKWTFYLHIQDSNVASLKIQPWFYKNLLLKISWSSPLPDIWPNIFLRSSWELFSIPSPTIWICCETKYGSIRMDENLYFFSMNPPYWIHKQLIHISTEWMLLVMQKS